MRIVASLTTLPKRLPFIYNTINSILTQTYPVDMIYINIPYKTKSGEKYMIPDNFYNDNPRVKIIRSQDYGPITKIYPTLHFEKDPDTLIITFDDDVNIKNTVVEILLEKHRQYPDACLSFSGWCVGKFPFYLQYANTNKKDVEVDWLQGVHSVLYPRKYLNSATLLDYSLDGKKVPKEVIVNDDVWLSVHVMRNNARCISINKRPRDYFQTLEHKKLDAISLRGMSFEIAGEIIRLCQYFSKTGDFKRACGAQYSMLVHFIPFLIAWGIIALLVFKYLKNPVIKLLILIVTLIVLYNIAFSEVAQG